MSPVRSLAETIGWAVMISLFCLLVFMIVRSLSANCQAHMNNNSEFLLLSGAMPWEHNDRSADKTPSEKKVP